MLHGGRSFNSPCRRLQPRTFGLQSHDGRNTARKLEGCATSSTCSAHQVLVHLQSNIKSSFNVVDGLECYRCFCADMFHWPIAPFTLSCSDCDTAMDSIVVQQLDSWQTKRCSKMGGDNTCGYYHHTILGVSKLTNIRQT